MQFADALEKASLLTIESGRMTGDLVSLWEKDEPAVKLNSRDFLLAIQENLNQILNA